jgi:hypothetical protein
MQLWNIEEEHPGLKSSRYEITSETTDIYNCIAWAAGDDTDWWSYTPGSYWPLSIPRSAEVGALVRVFETLDYSLCDSRERETDYDKVALYAQEGEWTHVARQLENGHWTSKLGQFEDITHPALENLVGEVFGIIHCIMRRPSANP